MTLCCLDDALLSENNIHSHNSSKIVLVFSYTMLLRFLQWFCDEYLLTKYNCNALIALFTLENNIHCRKLLKGQQGLMA